MSAPLHEVADAVRALKKWTDAIATLGSYVENLASAEQAAGEINVRLGAMREEEAKQAVALAEAEEKIQAAQQRLVAVRRQAEADAVNANAVARNAVAEAKAEASRIVADAKVEAAKLRDGLDAQARKLTDDIAALRLERDGLSAQVDERKADLAQAEAQLADARAAIAKLLKA